MTKRIDELAAGYLPALVLFTATELALFEAIASVEGPCSLVELAQRIHATLDGTTRLCRALAALELLALDDGHVRLTADAEALIGEAAAPLRAMLTVHRRHLLPPLTRLAQAVRTGTPQHAAWPFASIPIAETPYDELARHPAELRTLALAMDHGSVGVEIGRAHV